MYSIRALDPLPGDFMSVPTAINNHGRVVGGSSHGDYSTQRAVVWGSPRPYELGELVATYSPTNLQPSLDAGALASIANDINDEGEIVGYWWRILDAHNTSTRAFKLAVAGAYTALPPLAERDGSAAYAINAGGDVVGQSADALQPGAWGWHVRCVGPRAEAPSIWDASPKTRTLFRRGNGDTRLTASTRTVRSVAGCRRYPPLMRFDGTPPPVSSP